MLRTGSTALLPVEKKNPAVKVRSEDQAVRSGEDFTGIFLSSLDRAFSVWLVKMFEL